MASVAHRPVTTNEDAFMIEGHGVAVLGGISADENCPFEVGQTLIIHNPNSSEIRTARLKAIEYARLKTAEEEYGFVFYPGEIGVSDIPKGSRIFSGEALAADRETNSRIEWTGDLDDDCTARWAELMLRAEEMNRGSWWWAVYDERLGSLEVGSSNQSDHRATTGKEARRLAENCATDYLNVQPNKG